MNQTHIKLNKFWDRIKYICLKNSSLNQEFCSQFEKPRTYPIFETATVHSKIKYISSQFEKYHTHPIFDTVSFSAASEHLIYKQCLV